MSSRYIAFLAIISSVLATLLCTTVPAHADDSSFYWGASSSTKVSTNGDKATVVVVSDGSDSAPAVATATGGTVYPDANTRRLHEYAFCKIFTPTKNCMSLFENLGTLVPVYQHAEVESLAKSAAASLQVPAPQLTLWPDPSQNKWEVSAVGLPIWTWADGHTTVTESVTTEGIDISLSGSRQAVVLDWGDGSSSTCTTMSVRPQNTDPLTPSPDCGHTYTKRGDYTLTVSSKWEVTWHASNESGKILLTSATAIHQIRVREFSSVVVG